MCVCVCMYIYINICSSTNIYGKKTHCNKKNAASHLGRKKIKTLILI